MTTSVIVFWLGAILVFHAYFGYPLLVRFIGMWRAPRRSYPIEWPYVSLISPAYNEADVIRQKIRNCLALDYPRDRLEVIIVSDASTDETDLIVREYEGLGIRLLRQPLRTGQALAQNRAVAESDGEIIVLADANTFYERDTLRKLVAPFTDPSVGCVVGRLRNGNAQAAWVSRGEALYWRYEGALKRAQASAGALLFGSGAITAVRRSLFRPASAPWHLLDTIVPLHCRITGYRVACASAAVAWEDASTDGRKEFQRKVRTIMRDMKTILELKLLMSPFRPWLAFNLISSKVLRWLVGPILFLVFASNAFLLDQSLYRVTMAVQMIFYGLGVAGLSFPKINRRIMLFAFPAYFCLVNIAATTSLIRIVAGERITWMWEPRGG